MARGPNKSAVVKPRPKERTFRQHAVMADVNYPCHEHGALGVYQLQQLERMCLKPDDGVGRYSRRIPFRGTKSTLSSVTGRNHFDGECRVRARARARMRC